MERTRTQAFNRIKAAGRWLLAATNPANSCCGAQRQNEKGFLLLLAQRCVKKNTTADAVGCAWSEFTRTPLSLSIPHMTRWSLSSLRADLVDSDHEGIYREESPCYLKLNSKRIPPQWIPLWSLSTKSVLMLFHDSHTCKWLVVVVFIQSCHSNKVIETQ